MMIIQLPTEKENAILKISVPNFYTKNQIKRCIKIETGIWNDTEWKVRSFGKIKNILTGK